MKNEWIKVSEELPKGCKEVLVAAGSIGVYCMTHHYFKGKWYAYGHPHPVNYVTHWQPLPEPPQD